MNELTLQAEFEFTHPQGYADAKRTISQDMVIRLARAADGILALNDPLVQSNLLVPIVYPTLLGRNGKDVIMRGQGGRTPRS